MKRICIRLFGIILFIIASKACPDEVVYYSNDFLNNGGSPRASAMGEAMAADPGDRTAGMYNPAGLLGIERMTLFVSHSNIFNGLLNHNFVAFSSPLGGNRVVGAYLLRSSVDGIMDTRDFPLTPEGEPVFSSSKLGTVTNSDYALGLSYAALFGKNLRYGGTIKMIRRRLDQLEGYGIGLDAGAQYKLPAGVLLGITGKNLVTTATRYYADDWEIALPELYPGVSIKREAAYFYGSFEFSYQTQNLLSTSGVSQGPLGGSIDANNAAPSETGLLKDPVGFLFGGNLGIEYSMHDKLFLRIGTNSTYMYSLGVGLKIMNLNVDFAFLHHLELNDSYRFALAWDFKE